MAARLIRDGLLDSEAVLSLPVEARWVYVSILLSADDLGLFEATPFRIARKADIRRELADTMVQMLADRDLIRLYTVDGKQYGFVPRYRQRVQITRPRCPLPPTELLQGDQDAIKKINNLGRNPAVDRGDPAVTHGETRPEVEVEVEEKQIPPKPPKGGKAAVTFRSWAEDERKAGRPLIPETDTVFEYAKQVGLPDEFLALAWREFKARYSQPDAKRYKDWRCVFRKAVRGNWFRLWMLDGNGYRLTTVGEQSKRVEA